MGVVGFSCACGQVRGSVDVPSPASGNHIVCHCPDCRAAAILLGQPDPGSAGTELWQTTPDRVTITQGGELLAIQQLSPKGLFRWYAGCCNTPLFNTLRNPRLSFVGIAADRLSDTAPLGPLIGRAFMPGTGGRKYRHEGFNRIGFRIAKLMLAANLSGRWRQTPFFDRNGEPVAPPRVVAKEQRQAATP